MGKYVIDFSCDGRFDMKYEIEAKSEFLAINHATAKYLEMLKEMIEINIEEVNNES